MEQDPFWGLVRNSANGKRVVCLDQNAWIALARGAWDKAAHPDEHIALTRVVTALQAGRIVVPLSFSNIYETAKVNDPVRRTHLAHVQATISGGKVLRGRRRLLEEMLSRRLVEHASGERLALAEDWFLSDLWFEAAADYSPGTFGFEMSERALAWVRQNPARALFNYLAEADEAVRMEGVRRYSASSAELIARIEARRAMVAGETFAMRRRAYGAQLLVDELDFVFTLVKRLSLPWSNVRDLGPKLAKSLVADVPVLNVERELAVRLEDQQRAITENDLRDMASFAAVLPLADLFVAEKPFVNLARQAGLDRAYGVDLRTAVTELTDEML